MQKIETDYPASYWESGEWLESPDLLIVGGGIVGCSTALFYKEKFPEKRIVIAERGAIPKGASTRNAGFACIGSVSEHLADINLSGEEMVARRIKRRWKGLQLLRSVAGDSNLDYQQTGGVEIFTDPRQFERCRKEIPKLNQLVEKQAGEADVYSEMEYNGFPAIKNRLEGAINSGKLMRHLHQKLVEKGIPVWWNTTVNEVGTQKAVLNSGLTLYPKDIVLAVNGFHATLAGSPIRPARGFAMVTTPIKNLNWQGIFHYNEGYVYFRNVGNNQLLLGGGRNIDIAGETTFAFGTNQKIKSYLIDFAKNTLKLSSGWQPQYEWSGIMGMTPDKEPLIKQNKKGVWLAAGLSGMGIAISMPVAKELVDMMG